MTPRASEVEKAGFTLLEMMAVVFLTSIVMTAAVGFYVNLSRASADASERTRDGRRAVAIVDRVARDLESAYLVTKPAEVDPLAHPWLFVAERGRGELGSDALQFTMRGHRPRGDAIAASDLAVVAYVTRRGDDGLELWRWARPRLPEAQVRELPRAEDEGSVLLADGLAAFGVRFLDSEGAWVDRWDSTQVDRSSDLPVAAEIAVTLAPAEGDPEPELDREPETVRRRVLIPVRPVDLEALLEGVAAGDEAEEEEEASDEDCVTVAECLANNQELLQQAIQGGFLDDAAYQGLLQQGDLCVGELSVDLPPGVVGCE